MGTVVIREEGANHMEAETPVRAVFALAITVTVPVEGQPNMLGKVERRITHIWEKLLLYRIGERGLPYDPPRWHVEYQVTDKHGVNKGAWSQVVEAPDQAGAALKMLLHWKKLDARNERRWKKEQAGGEGADQAGEEAES
jgi:hypothetical protein